MTGAASPASTTIQDYGWPKDFGRDGVSGLVTLDRALRAREVSRPTPEDEELAESVLAELLARTEGRRHRRH